MKPVINLKVFVVNKGIVINEKHNNIDTAMNRGETLAHNLGGRWTITINK
jgi:hypothetical protein